MRTFAQLRTTNRHREIHDVFATFKSSRLERLKCLRNAVRALEFLAQNDAVFDRHSSALPEMRRRRMDGITDQQDVALVPIAIDKMHFERFVNDGIVVCDLLNVLGDTGRGTGELGTETLPPAIPCRTKDFRAPP